MAADTVRGLSAVYAPVVIPFVLSSHLVLALVKLNTKLSYLPLAMADPVGVRSYLAIWDLDLVPVPGALLPIGAVKIVSLAVLLAGTVISLVTYSRISRREGTGALPMLFPLLLLGAVVYGGLYNWLF